VHICYGTTGGLHVEVTDGGPGPALRTREPADECGRGLDIVAAISARHGTYTHAQGATHWADVAA
jgi:hypothetical protein